MNEEFSLRAVLGVDDKASGPIGQIRNHFKNLENSIGQSEGQLKNFNKHLTDLKSGAKSLAIGGALFAGIKSTIQPTIEFESAMGKLAGVAQATDTQMKAFTHSAIQAGLKTQFSS